MVAADKIPSSAVLLIGAENAKKLGSLSIDIIIHYTRCASQSRICLILPLFNRDPYPSDFWHPTACLYNIRMTVCTAECTSIHVHSYMPTGVFLYIISDGFLDGQFFDKFLISWLYKYPEFIIWNFPISITISLPDSLIYDLLWNKSVINIWCMRYTLPPINLPEVDHWPNYLQPLSLVS